MVHAKRMATETLPKTATLCERHTSIRSFASLLSAALPPSLRSTCSAKLAAVMAGCFVATVQCSMWMSMKPMP